MFKLDLDVSDDPIVKVQTTHNRGFSPDEVAERCVEKLISVSDKAHPAIRDQAKAFQTHGKGGCILYARSYSQRPHNRV